MLICNNCFTQNPDETTTCVHCKMSGDFTHQEEGGIIKSIPQRKEENACKNCGNHDPGIGAKCVHCNFPISVKPQQVNGQSKIKYKVIG